MLRISFLAITALLTLSLPLSAATFVAFLQDEEPAAPAVEAPDAPTVEAPEAPADEEPADPAVTSPSDIKVTPKEPMPMEGDSPEAGGDPIDPAAPAVEGAMVVQSHGEVIYACPPPCPIVCQPVVCQPACQPTCKPKKRCRLFGRR